MQSNPSMKCEEPFNGSAPWTWVRVGFLGRDTPVGVDVLLGWGPSRSVVTAK